MDAGIPFNYETRSVNQILIQVGEPLFSFSKWEQKAKSWFANCDVFTWNIICIDVVGRICTSGVHFMRAEEEGTYPITAYNIEWE